MGHLANAGALIVQVLFGLVIGLFFFRLLMQGLRVDLRNPLSQFVYRLTNPVLIPIQKALPVVNGWNLAALLITFLLTLLETWLLYRLAGFGLPLLALLVIALAMLIQFAATALLWMIIVRAILSFVSPDPAIIIGSLCGESTASVGFTGGRKSTRKPWRAPSSPGAGTAVSRINQEIHHDHDHRRQGRSRQGPRPWRCRHRLPRSSGGAAHRAHQ